MMPETVAELAAGNVVNVANLFRFEFRSSTQRFWNGLGWLTAGGQDWQASGSLINVSGLEQASGMRATPATFTLAATTPELLAAAIDSEEEVTDRPCAVFIQFLTARYQPLDNPIAIWTGRMGSLMFSGTVGEQQLSLAAETIWIDRIRAPYGYMTDTDQQARWPEDRGMEFMPLLKNKTVNWLRS